MKSSARREFTIRHLVRRKFGLENVEDALIGPESFSGCMNKELEKASTLFNYFLHFIIP